MQRSFFLIAMLVSFLLAAAEFAVSPAWEYPSIMGRDFWNIGHVIMDTKGDSEPVADSWSCIARGGLHFPLENASPASRRWQKIPLSAMWRRCMKFARMA